MIELRGQQSCRGKWGVEGPPQKSVPHRNFGRDRSIQKVPPSIPAHVCTGCRRSPPVANRSRCSGTGTRAPRRRLAFPGSSSGGRTSMFPSFAARPCPTSSTPPHPRVHYNWHMLPVNTDATFVRKFFTPETEIDHRITPLESHLGFVHLLIVPVSRRRYP
jgi:hypothetical protein